MSANCRPDIDTWSATLTPEQAALRWASARPVPPVARRLSYSDARVEAPHGVDRTTFANELVRLGYARPLGAGTPSKLTQWTVRSTADELRDIDDRVRESGLSRSQWVLRQCRESE